LLVAMKTRA